jgi:hypothetical protein
MVEPSVTPLMVTDRKRILCVIVNSPVVVLIVPVREEKSGLEIWLPA